MHLIAKAGTDVAAVGVADPTLVRTDAARRWQAETGADGPYLFHIFVGESPPEAIKPYLQDPIEVAGFEVASGRLLVAGAEVLDGHQPTDPLNPALGEFVSIPPGIYHLTAFRTEYPPDLVDQRFLQAAGPRLQQAWHRGNNVVGISILLFFLVIVGTYFLFLRFPSPFVLAIPFSVVLGTTLYARGLRRSPEFLEASRLFRAIELEFPSIVLVFRTGSAA